MYTIYWHIVFDEREAPLHALNRERHDVARIFQRRFSRNGESTDNRSDRKMFPHMFYFHFR